MKTSCTSCEELIDLQAAGWLSDEQVALLADHLDSCPACREQTETALAVGRLLADQPAPAAPAINLAKRDAPVACIPWKWLIAPAMAASLILAVRVLQPGPDAPLPAPPAHTTVAELSEAPPTLATYRLAAALSDDDLGQVLDAHDRNSPLYEPPMMLLAYRNNLEGLLL
jgi:hypothetical protein